VWYCEQSHFGGSFRTQCEWSIQCFFDPPLSAICAQWQCFVMPQQKNTLTQSLFFFSQIYFFSKYANPTHLTQYIYLWAKVSFTLLFLVYFHLAPIFINKLLYINKIIIYISVIWIYKIHNDIKVSQTYI